MKKEKQISVVVPAYNREHLLPRALASIAAQTVHDFDVILVDNNSTDGTLALMERWAAEQPFDVRVLSERRQGAAAARQCGAEAARTPWLRFFDSDDVLVPDHIENILKAIEQNPEAGLIGWPIKLILSPTDCRTGDFVTEDMQYRSLMNGIMGTERWCVRRDVFTRAGGWCLEAGVWDDIELGARMLAQKPAVVKLCDAPQVDAYLQPDSITQGETAANIAAIDRALSRIEATLGPDKAHWTALKRMIVAATTPGDGGEELRRRVLAEAPSHRAVLRFAYAYTRRGGRGIARILRLLRLV